MKKFILKKIESILDSIENLMIDFMFDYPNFPIVISVLSLIFSLIVLYIKLFNCTLYKVI